MNAQRTFTDLILEKAQRDYRNASHGQKTAKLKKLQTTMRKLLDLELSLSSKGTRRVAA